MLSMRIVQRAVSRPPVSVESRGWKNVSDGICDMREVTTMRFLSLFSLANGWAQQEAAKAPPRMALRAAILTLGTEFATKPSNFMMNRNRFDISKVPVSRSFCV